MHGIEPWSSHDHVVDSGLIDYRELDDFVISLAMTGNWIDPRVIDTSPKKTGERFRRRNYFSEFDAHPLESVAEDYVDRASRVDEYPSEF